MSDRIRRPFSPAARTALAVLGLAALCALSACELLQPAPQPPVVPVPPPAAPAPASAPEPVPQPPATPPSDPVGDSGRQLVAWQDELRQQPPEFAISQAGRLFADAGTQTSPSASLHLALAWLHTRAPGDTGRAVSLLDSLQKAPEAAAGPWVAWARLLAVRAQEQKRLEDNLERQNQQLRENTRRIEQLNGQLEALKAIERSLAPKQRAGEGR